MATGVRRGAIAATLVMAAIPALSQSCPLCYTEAASSGARFIAALRSGILMLIIPPMFMSAAITWLAYRKRRPVRRQGGGVASGSSNRDGFEP
jgi:hypothetical protein